MPPIEPVAHLIYARAIVPFSHCSPCPPDAELWHQVVSSIMLDIAHEIAQALQPHLPFPPDLQEGIAALIYEDAMVPATKQQPCPSSWQPDGNTPMQDLARRVALRIQEIVSRDQDAREAEAYAALEAEAEAHARAEAEAHAMWAEAQAMAEEGWR